MEGRNIIGSQINFLLHDGPMDHRVPASENYPALFAIMRIAIFGSKYIQTTEDSKKRHGVSY